MQDDLLIEVHRFLNIPSQKSDCIAHIVKGKYYYYHYKCDGFNDVGWGCGYRTLQTIASFLHEQGKAHPVPTIRQIQDTLVEMEDKRPPFAGSRDWIGSFEICLVIDKLYDVACKIVHCPPGSDLKTMAFPKLEEHFAKHEKSAPVMMGGDRDAASKGVFGTCRDSENFWLLVLDPHYHGAPASIRKLQREGYVRWVPLSEFDRHSFYNFCLPQFGCN